MNGIAGSKRPGATMRSRRAFLGKVYTIRGRAKPTRVRRKMQAFGENRIDHHGRMIASVNNSGIHPNVLFILQFKFFHIIIAIYQK